MATALVYHTDFAQYDFGEDHALRQIRVRLARDLISQYGLLTGAEEIPPAPASEDVVRRVHTPEYLSVVKDLSVQPSGVAYEHGLGTTDNPVFEGMYEAALLHVGGTLRACE